MELKGIAGGYQLSEDDKRLLNKQRAITKSINDQFIQVGAIFLKMSSKNPHEDDWYKRSHRDTNLQSWIDEPDLLYHNVGFNLQTGWMDIDIDAEDPEFNKCVLAAMEYLQIDTRFKFGRKSVGVATHVMVQLGEDESSHFDKLTRFEPREFRLNGKRYHVQLRSFSTNTKAENVAATAKQTVMPGSIYTHKTSAGQPDFSVWYTRDGIAEKAGNVAATTPRRVNFNEVVRAITFATFLYSLRDHWIEGSRHSTAQKVTGWLARIVKDSAAINNNESIASEVYCPVDTLEIAERLIEFVCTHMNDDEKHMRIRALHDAAQKLERNPDAKVPGWPALEQLLGGQYAVALRTVFMPGSDVSQLTAMSERYLYDESDNFYVDRTRFFSMGNYVHEAAHLERRHLGDTIRVGGKPKKAFAVFESSDMRKRIGMRNMYPDLNPGGVYRVSNLGEVLSDEDDADDGALTIFNTWRGWPIKPTNNYDAKLMEKLIGMLDQVLGWLTQDKEPQIAWIKKWLAWTFQRPGDKQQIAWVVIGDQGIGKSWIGNTFVQALMGSLWGSASPKVVDGDFAVEPFIGKMFVFIDEAKFNSDTGVDEIKKLIRSIDVPGAVKFESSTNHRLFARMMFASNRLNIGIGQANTRDRSLFYTKAYDREYTGKAEHEFRAWAETLKPFFEEFTQLMADRNVREHFMYYFMNMEVSKSEVESIKESSSNDAGIVLHNMSWTRRVAKYIIEDGRIFDDLDISFPFTISDLNKRVGEVSMELGFRSMQGAHILAEYEQAGLLERVTVGGMKKLRFREKIGSLTASFGKAISLDLDSKFLFDENDFGPNTCDGSTRPPWKGMKRGVVQEAKF